MSIFDASEIFRFAVRIEENGEKFYRSAGAMTEDEETKKLFVYLADEEVSHRKTFESLLSKMEKYEPTESYPGEYFAYLRAYVDKIIFTDEELNAKAGEAAVAAIEFAVRQEMNSMLYYHEMKKFVSEGQHLQIDRIIDEEREHFLKLSELQESYKNKEV